MNIQFINKNHCVLSMRYYFKGHTLRSLQVDGDMTHDDALIQLHSDIIGIDTVRPSMLETTALGAAMAAGAADGINVWDLSDQSPNSNNNNCDVFSPKTSQTGIKTSVNNLIHMSRYILFKFS